MPDHTTEILKAHRASVVDRYFIDMESLSNPKSLNRSAQPDEPTKNTVGGKTVYCTTTKYNLSSNPDEIILYSPDIETMWLGALIQGSSLGKGIGSFREVPFGKRAPLDIAVNVLAGNNKTTAKNPNAPEVNKAIGDLLDRLSKDKIKYGSAVSFKFCETYSLQQALVELGFSAHYGGAEFEAKHKEATTAESRVVTVSYIEKCFTVFIGNPTSPAALFSPDFGTNDIRLQESMGRVSKSNPPALLTTISYGRMFYCTISSSRSMEELTSALTASYSSGAGGGSATFNEGHKKVLSESKFTVSTIGIPQSAVAAVIQSGSYKDLLSKEMDIATAMPISFIFRNLVDLSIASYVNSAEYTMTVCVPQKASGEIVACCVAVDARFKDFYNCVDAAAGNRDDQPTRDERVRGYRNNHNLVKFNLGLLKERAASFPAGNKDDRDYCKEWLQQLINTIREQMVMFKSKHDNQPWAVGFYQEGYNDCSEQLALAETIRALL